MIIKVQTKEKQAKEAFRLKKEHNIPFGDALHAVIARDNDSILVTRDKHLEELTNMVQVNKPEELI